MNTKFQIYFSVQIVIFQAQSYVTSQPRSQSDFMQIQTIPGQPFGQQPEIGSRNQQTNDLNTNDEEIKGCGLETYAILMKFHIILLLRIISFILSIANLILFVFSLFQCISFGHFIKILFVFYGGFNVGVVESEICVYCKRKKCCSSSCCDCECLKCGNCGFEKKCCLDLIVCHFFTCIDCKRCVCCSCRNYFYCDITNPFLECKRIITILVYFIWRIIASIISKIDFEEIFDNKEIKECNEKLDAEIDLMLSLSYIIIVKIVLQQILGLIILVEKYQNKKNKA